MRTQSVNITNIYNKYQSSITKNSIEKTESLSNTPININNATRGEINQFAAELYDAGEITLLERGMMTLMNGWELKNGADPNEKINWMSEYQSRANLCLSNGAKSGYNTYTSILDVLKKHITT